jgi:acetyl esterase/lipase
MTHIITNLSYGPHPRAHLLDVVFSEHKGEPKPVVLHFHGGGWQQFGKYPPDCAPLAEAGCLVITANYHYSQEAIFPAQLNDVLAVVEWANANANRFGGDANRLGAWGISAGGHLAALLGAIGAVQAVAAVAAPLDFLHSEWKTHPSNQTGPIAALLGGPVTERLAAAAQASPLHQLTTSKQSGRFLMIHGANDDLVPISQAHAMHNALQNRGISSELIVFPEGDHFINESHWSVMQQALVGFFERQLS